MTDTKKCYWRRLARSQVYYVGAGICGIYLVSQYPIIEYFGLQLEAKPVEHLLSDWSDLHEKAFSFAVTHWIISTWEDYCCGDLVNLDIHKQVPGAEVAVIVDEETKEEHFPVLGMYIWHHISTALVYFGIICSGGRLSVLGCFGLVYEVPPAILNIREFAVVFKEEYDCFERLANHMARLWAIIMWATLLCRGFPSVVYFYSLVFWRPQLAQLSRDTWISYHSLGVGFTMSNWNWYLMLRVWRSQDMSNIRLMIGEENKSKKIQSV